MQFKLRVVGKEKRMMQESLSTKVLSQEKVEEVQS
jgi:hypothetical protein